jgi:aminoglycoside phosphotransferase family enzyme/predicted kinase
MNDHSGAQDAVFAFLGDPATHGGQPVRRIDTHAAAVFLSGDRAFKVKRAVRFPFLDFTTLDRRRAACEAELAVNRPFAPQIYRGVVAVSREADGALALGGRGAPIEWAVEMRRFDENATLDRLADQGGVDPDLADALGRVVAKAHAAAPVIEAGPWIEALARFIAQSESELAQDPDLFDSGEIADLTSASRGALDRIRPLLARRGLSGFVRRGHGDLHLGNIALIDGRPVPFDALEFDPLTGAGDVLYDLAFLLMDLLRRDLPQAANAVFNRYLTATGGADHLDALAALPLFLSMRAAIRAKVTAARLRQDRTAESAEIRRSAQAYFALARRLIAPPAPVLCAIGGLSGTGKSVLARALAPGIAPAPGAVLLRSDVERKALFGRAETDRLPPDAYASDTTREVYARLIDKARRTLAAGHSAVVDAVFARPKERAALAALGRSLGVGFRGLFLTADLAVRRQRVGARIADASDADAGVVEQQERYDLGALDWSPVDASGTPADTLARARAAMA